MGWYFNHKCKLRILSTQKYLKDFMYSYDCQTYWDPNICTAPMTVCRRPEDDQMLGRNM